MKQKQKQLKFIHITKTGGISIESSALKKGIFWGLFNWIEYGFAHHYFSEKDPVLRNKYDWFMVVRNPYTRILSEYYCNFGKLDNKNINQSVEEMNQYLINRIKTRNQITFFSNPYIYGHFLEQYKYLTDDNTIHILKFENLNEDFNNLMKQYNLVIELSHENKGKNKIFTINDFSKELIDLINEVYDKDFLYFNYDKIML
jgi:hypothetical protein